jgi:hypothetical protein
MRQPSINPPSFYEDIAPPPLLTPPPNYDDLTPRIEVRDGYFDIEGSGNNSEEDVVEEEPVEAPPEEEAGEEEEEDDQEEDEQEEEAQDEEAQEEEEQDEEEDIVHMVGLEDLSLGLRAGSPVGRRSSDQGFSIWAR